FQRVVHHLLAPKGATLAGLKTVHSHIHALPQCRKIIRELGLTAVVHADTAGAAADGAGPGRKDQAPPPPPQCRKIIRELGLTAVVHADTAGAAADVAALGDKTQAAIASDLAGEI